MLEEAGIYHCLITQPNFFCLLVIPSTDNILLVGKVKNTINVPERSIAGLSCCFCVTVVKKLNEA